MIKILLTIFCILTSINTFATNIPPCKTYFPKDLIFCSNKIKYTINVIGYDEAHNSLISFLDKNKEEKYIKESIVSLAENTSDLRFSYTKKPDGAISKVVYPSNDGMFATFRIKHENKKYIYVVWDDLNQSSYSLLFEDHSPLELVYIYYEN